MNESGEIAKLPDKESTISDAKNAVPSDLPQKNNPAIAVIGALIALILFVGTFTLYITNGENKLIYYVVRPFLNKHYDAQVRDKRIV